MLYPAELHALDLLRILYPLSQNGVESVALTLSSPRRSLPDDSQPVA